MILPVRVRGDAASPLREPENKESKPLSARTINVHRLALVALCNWLVTEGRLVANPLAALPKAEETGPACKRRPLFRLGRNFLSAFDLDLIAADIPKRDAQSRTVDVHSLRHTFATLLARGGVSPGVAQRLVATAITA